MPNVYCPRAGPGQGQLPLASTIGVIRHNDMENFPPLGLLPVLLFDITETDVMVAPVRTGLVNKTC